MKFNRPSGGFAAGSGISSTDKSWIMHNGRRLAAYRAETCGKRFWRRRNQRKIIKQVGTNSRSRSPFRRIPGGSVGGVQPRRAPVMSMCNRGKCECAFEWRKFRSYGTLRPSCRLPGTSGTRSRAKSRRSRLFMRIRSWNCPRNGANEFAAAHRETHGADKFLGHFEPKTRAGLSPIHVEPILDPPRADESIVRSGNRSVTILICFCYTRHEGRKRLLGGNNRNWRWTGSRWSVSREI